MTGRNTRRWRVDAIRSMPERTTRRPLAVGVIVGELAVAAAIVIDTGGDSIEVIWSGRTYEDEDVVGHRFTLRAGTEPS